MVLAVVLQPGYLLARNFGWALLLTVALVDTYLHRHVKRRGHQLQRGVMVTIFAYIVQDVLLTSFALLRQQKSAAAFRVYLAYIFMTDLSDSLFILLLLFIAAGYCITRDSLGPYRGRSLYIPLCYFVATLIVDLVIANLRGSSQSWDDEEDVSIDHVNSFVVLLLNILEILSLGAYFLSWVFIFDTCQREREVLEKPKEGTINTVARPAGHRVGDEESQIGSGPQRPGAGAANGVPGGEPVGHDTEVPRDALLEDGAVRSDVYAEVTGTDTDAAQTVEDRLAHRSKLALMRQFMWGVGAYIAARAVAILLPIFYFQSPGDEDVAIRAVLILENTVLWLFLATLCYIFRMREDNPYLLLDEEGAGPAGPGGNELELTTELGDGSHEEGYSPKGGRQRVAGDHGAPAALHAVAVDRNFSLGDEDEGSPSHRATPSRSGSPRKHDPAKAD